MRALTCATCAGASLRVQQVCCEMGKATPKRGLAVVASGAQRCGASPTAFQLLVFLLQELQFRAMLLIERLPRWWWWSWAKNRCC